MCSCSCAFNDDFKRQRNTVQDQGLVRPARESTSADIWLLISGLVWNKIFFGMGLNAHTVHQCSHPTYLEFPFKFDGNSVFWPTENDRNMWNRSSHGPAAGADLSHSLGPLKAVSEGRKSWPNRCLINKCLPSECATSAVHSPPCTDLKKKKKLSQSDQVP